MEEQESVSLDDKIECMKSEWIQEQCEIRKKIVELDMCPRLTEGDWRYIGGLDISFIVGDDINAAACYVIIDRDLQIVYQDVTMVQMTAPYIPGFLAFREANFLIDLVKRQRREAPCITPEIIFVDGNGLLHPRQVGVACHIGVITGLPTVGVAKNLHQIQEFGPEFTRESVRSRLNSVTMTGEYITLSTEKGRTLGAAVKTSSDSNNPVFVSVGSGLSLKTGIKIVNQVSRYRIPEPTRQADIISREYLRKHHPIEKQIQQGKKVKNKQN